MKRLLTYMKAYKLESVLGPLFKLLEASFELFVPLVIAAVIDTGIAKKDTGYILKMSGVLVLLALIGLTCAVTAQYFAARASVGTCTKMRSALFSHIETLGFAEMDSIGISTLITRMTSDINQVQSGVNLVLRLFLRSPFIVFGAMIMAFTVNVKAALVFVVTIPLLSIVVFGVMLVSMPLYKKVQGGLDRVLGRTRESLSGARVIRAFDQGAKEKAEFEEETALLTNMQIIVGRVSALTNPLTYIIINVSIVAVIWVAGGEVFDGIITQGEVVALVNYMSQILVELVKLANLIVNITKSLACLNRIDEVMNTTSSLELPFASKQEAEKQTGKFPAADGYVVFDHAGMRYSGTSEEAVSDITMTVRKGQTIGIIGGTGSGKTTVVHLIPRFYDVSSGAVYVDGKDVRSYDLSELRSRIGIVMQKAVLFAGTIEENLRLGNKDASEEDLWKALEVAQATDVVRSKEDGLKSWVEEGGKNLSGGQKQRLTIARAVVRDPEILILDDSASALDFQTDARLRAALRNLQGEKTIFIVSQRTSSIQFADQILVLDDGEAVGLGTHEELLESCDVYREIYESQFRGNDSKAGGAK